MFSWRKNKKYGYAEETRDLIEKSKELRAEMRALTERSKERTRQMRLEREAARNSE